VFPILKCYQISLLCCTQRKIFVRMFVTKQISPPIDCHSIFFPTVLVNVGRDLLGYKHSSKYLCLCSAEQRNLYRFGTTWGGLNDDRIFIFGWTIPLSEKQVSGCFNYIFLIQFFSKCSFIRVDTSCNPTHDVFHYFT